MTDRPEPNTNPSPRETQWHILHVVDGLGAYGGTERNVVRNLRHFTDSRLRHSLVVLYDRMGRAAEVPGSVEVICLSRPGESMPWLPVLMRRLSALVRQSQPDLIHCSLANSSLASRVVGQLRGIPVVESLVNLSYEPIRLVNNPGIKRRNFEAHRLLDRLTMARVARFHAVSDAVATSWSRYVRIPPSKIWTIPRGLELDELRAEIEAADSRQVVLSSLGVPSTAFVLLNVGRQEAQKGQLHVIEAMAEIIRRHRDSVLLIVGPEGQASPRLRRTVTDFGLANHVRFLGQRSDVVRLMRAADLFVFPSLYEGLPNALVEAMACGLPCVAFDLPPMNQVLKSGVTGVLTTPQSSSDLAGTVSLLVDNAELRSSLGSAARGEAETKYSAKNVALALEGLYLDMLQNHRSGKVMQVDG